MTEKKASYHSKHLLDKNQTEISWAYQVNNPVLDARINKTALKTRALSRFPNSDDALDPAYVRAYLAAERAQGQITGQSILSRRTIARSSTVPIVYAARSGKTFAEGIAHAFSLQGIRTNIVGVTGSKEDATRVRHGFAVPELVIDQGNNSGLLVLCDGTLKEGNTLSAMVESLKGKFKGALVVANSNEQVMKSTPLEQMSYNRLYDTLIALQSSDPHITFDYIVGRRAYDILEVNPLKIGALIEWQNSR